MLPNNFTLLLCCGRGDVGVLVVSERHGRSMNALSFQRPRPLTEILTPVAASVPVKAALVNWLPWSVLKISGRPKRVKASPSADTQNDVSIVFDRRHASTAWLAQSMIVTRYRKPWPIGK